MVPKHKVKRRHIESSDKSLGKSLDKSFKSTDKSGETSIKFNELPEELLYFIFEHSESRDLVNLCTTNSRLWKILKPLIYNKILVYNQKIFTRLSSGKYSLSDNEYPGYTVVSRDNYLKLMSMESFEPELVKSVVFYFFFPPTSNYVNRLQPECKTKSTKGREEVYDVPGLEFHDELIGNDYFKEEYVIDQDVESMMAHFKYSGEDEQESDLGFSD